MTSQVVYFLDLPYHFLKFQMSCSVEYAIDAETLLFWQSFIVIQ